MNAEKGIEVAEEDDGPILFEDLYWVWDGFLILSNSRPIGMAGPLHITFSEISHYCEIYGIDRHAKKVYFTDLVKLLDNLWIEDYYDKDRKRREAEDFKNKNKNKKTK